MNHEERLIVTAYTGVLMTDFPSFHAYAEKVLERPIYTHEFASKKTKESLREAAKHDFLKLCEVTE